MAGQMVLFALVVCVAVSIISGAAVWDSDTDSLRGPSSRSHDRDMGRSTQQGYGNWDMSNEKQQKGERWESFSRQSPKRQRFGEGNYSFLNFSRKKRDLFKSKIYYFQTKLPTEVRNIF